MQTCISTDQKSVFIYIQLSRSGTTSSSAVVMWSSQVQHRSACKAHPLQGRHAVLLAAHFPSPLPHTSHSPWAPNLFVHLSNQHRTCKGGIDLLWSWSPLCLNASGACSTSTWPTPAVLSGSWLLWTSAWAFWLNRRRAAYLFGCHQFPSVLQVLVSWCEIVEPVMPRLVSGLVMQVVRVVSVGGGRVADGGDF